MRYYLDTEFIEDGKTIDLISIGIVAEDGRELYLGNKQCDFSKADEWVADNVLVPLGFKRTGTGQDWNSGWFSANLANPFWQSRQYIKEQILFFFAGGDVNLKEDQVVDADNYKSVEVWADYGSYDWIALCQLFGKMIDLPKGFPMYIHDLQQECDRLGKMNQYYQLPPQPAGQHNALEDARWLKSAYESLGL